MINYAQPGDLPDDYKPKLVVVYAAGLKIYGCLPYLLQRRLQARFNSSEVGGGGMRVFGPTWEPNYTIVPWRRDDGALHSPENLKALIQWLESGKGYIWVIAGPENFNDRLDTPWGRHLPEAFQPLDTHSDSEGLLALMTGK